MDNQNVNLLRAYKLQNPVKYKLKFGDKLPEDIILPPAPPEPVGPIKVELRGVKEIELELKPEPEILAQPLTAEPASQGEPVISPAAITEPVLPPKRKPGRPKKSAR